MSSNITNIAKIQQDFMNDILQNDQQNCIAQQTQQATGNIIVVSGGVIDGDFIGVRQVQNTDASCLMVSNMQNTVENVLSATLQQTNQAVTDWFNDFSYTDETNIFDISQSITNNISQINEATCSASNIQAATNNYIYVPDTRVRGNFIGVSQDSNASANCSMTNMMKNATYNKAQASATQSNTTIGMFTAIAAVIAAIIGLMVISSIIYYSTGGFGRRGTAAAATPQLTPEERELQAAQELGLTPDLLQLLTQDPQALA